LAKNPHPIFIVLLIRYCSAKRGQRYTQVTLRAVCALGEIYTSDYVTGLRNAIYDHLHIEKPATALLLLADSHVMVVSADSLTVESYVRDHSAVFPSVQVQHLKVYGSDCTYSANLRMALERICGMSFGRIHPDEKYKDIPSIQAIVTGGLAVERSGRPQFYKEHAFWLLLSVPPSPAVQRVIANMAGTELQPEWTGMTFDQILDALRVHDRPTLQSSQPSITAFRPSNHLLSLEELAKLQRGQLTLQDLLHPSPSPLLLQSAAHAAGAADSAQDGEPVTSLSPDELDQALAASEATTARLRAAREFLNSKPKTDGPSSSQIAPSFFSNSTPAVGASASIPPTNK